MSRPSRAILLGGLAIAALLGMRLTAAAGDNAPRAAVVVRVIDGDTVVLDNGERLRYIGMDTPELHHPTRGREPFGEEAKAFNASLVLRQRVRIDYDVERRDRYGRLLGYCFLEDGTFVNAELVRQGFAQPYTIPPNVKHADLFLKYSREARQMKRGLWGQR